MNHGKERTHGKPAERENGLMAFAACLLPPEDAM